MKRIPEILKDREQLGEDQVFDVIDYVGQNGDIMIIKVDGLRSEDQNKYTVIITPGRNSFEAIRYDSAVLSEGVQKSFSQYVNVLKLG